MSTNAARMLVLVGDKFSCIKIIGRADFKSSVDFKRLLNELIAKGFDYFIIELSECVLMDSTFLGVLTGFGLQMNPQSGDGKGAIELLNANPRIAELLENLGVLQLFKLTQGPLQPPTGCQTHTLIPIEPAKDEVTETCLEAHRTLMAANPDNVPRFKDVTRFLAEDLKKIKAAN